MSAQHKLTAVGRWVLFSPSRDDAHIIAGVFDVADDPSGLARQFAAAPDMLAAARQYDAYLSKYYSGTDSNALNEEARASWKATRAAIARAEGREP
jgi:hypothetical protein